MRWSLAAFPLRTDFGVRNGVCWDEKGVVNGVVVMGLKTGSSYT